MWRAREHNHNRLIKAQQHESENSIRNQMQVAGVQPIKINDKRRQAIKRGEMCKYNQNKNGQRSKINTGMNSIKINYSSCSLMYSQAQEESRANTKPILTPGGGLVWSIPIISTIIKSNCLANKQEKQTKQKIKKYAEQANAS